MSRDELLAQTESKIAARGAGMRSNLTVLAATKLEINLIRYIRRSTSDSLQVSSV